MRVYQSHLAAGKDRLPLSSEALRARERREQALGRFSTLADAVGDAEAPVGCPGEGEAGVAL